MHGWLELARDLRYGTSLTSSARSANSRFRKHDWLDFFSFRLVQAQGLKSAHSLVFALINDMS
jgi:hypothetical protein